MRQSGARAYSPIALSWLGTTIVALLLSVLWPRPGCCDSWMGVHLTEFWLKVMGGVALHVFVLAPLTANLLDERDLDGFGTRFATAVPLVLTFAMAVVVTWRASQY